MEELGRLVRCAFVAASAGSERTGSLRRSSSARSSHQLSLFARLLQVDIGRPAAGELRAAAVAGTTSLEIVLTAHGRPTAASLEVMGTEPTACADLFHGSPRSIAVARVAS